MKKTLEFLLSDSEIVNLVNQLRRDDLNKFANEQIILDYQRHTTSYNFNDDAEKRYHCERIIWMSEFLNKVDKCFAFRKNLEYNQF